MNAITHADLLNLVEASGDRFVSLYLPTCSAGREMLQNPIRFKTLLHKAAEALFAKGMNGSELRSFLEPAQDLLEQPQFWTTQSHGLAVFVSRKSMRSLAAAIRVRATVPCGQAFSRDAANWLADGRHALLCAGSQPASCAAAVGHAVQSARSVGS